MTLEEGLNTTVPSVPSGRSSAYYRDLKSKLSNLKTVFYRYNTLKKYVDVLESATSTLNTCKDKASNALNAYKGGGYIVDGETLDKGNEGGSLTDCINYFNQAINTLNNIKQKTITAADIYESKYNQSKERYDLAESYYQSALARERQAASEL